METPAFFFGQDRGGVAGLMADRSAAQPEADALNVRYGWKADVSSAHISALTHFSHPLGGRRSQAVLGREPLEVPRARIDRVRLGSPSTNPLR